MLVKTTVKYIQSLGQKKFRDAENLFVAEGPKLVVELLQAETALVKKVFATREWIDNNPSLLKQAEITEITEAELERISQQPAPNQVLALVEQFDASEIIPGAGKIIIALDGLQDPGNLGSIIRIADWFGIKQIVCSLACADIYNPKVVQATMGSIARVKVKYTVLTEWLATVGDKRIYAAAMQGEDVTGIKKINDGILVIGNEGRGIDPLIMNMRVTPVTIPRKGGAESLNAAVATGIILSHVL